MSEVKAVIRLELLPNEILMECFGYLDSMDIFYSFDQLNYRFNELIRNIPLYISLQYVETPTCIQFFRKMFFDDEIKSQVYALHLSNKGICYQIRPFLQLFSLHAFSNLRSLTLIHITKKNVSQLKAMLPLISQLSSFRIIHSMDENDKTVLALPNCELQTLMLPSLPSNLNLIYKVSSIVNLTITVCNLMGINQILIDVPQLKYLNVQYVTKPRDGIEKKYITDYQAIHLTKLIITNFQDTLDDLIIVLKLTPKLKTLILDTYFNTGTIDAGRWQHLITCSLSHLKSFKFKFREIFLSIDFAQLNNKFKEFQSDFWKEHHWYTEYSISNNTALIYTIPYVSDRYELMLNTIRCCNDSMSNFNIFKNTTDVSINFDALIESCQYYFPSVTSLTLKYSRLNNENNSVLEEQCVASLKKVVNLSNVKHLDISYFCKLESPDVLSELLKEAPQISSIGIQSSALLPLFDDNELCVYLNTMIKRLDISQLYSTLEINSCNLDKFCNVFSEIEQLACKIDQIDSLLFLLKHLPQLLRLNLYSSVFELENVDSLEEEVRKLGLELIIDVSRGWHPQPIWIFRNID